MFCSGIIIAFSENIYNTNYSLQTPKFEKEKVETYRRFFNHVNCQKM